tara:strand:+ start:4646 stop:5863 length:1218 start_codon:yes stop_codon:yes gene_type:complete
MSKNLYSLYFLIVLFANIYLFKVKIIGDFSIRLPLSLINLLIIIFLYRNKKINLKLLIFPLIFLLFSIISVIISDVGQLNLFISNTFLSRFLLTYILVGLTVTLIPNYISFNKLINILIIVSSINSIAIIAQFLDYNYIWILADIISEERHAVYDLKTLIEIKSVYLGLAGAVQSGYLLCILIPLILYKINLGENKIFWFCFLCINIFLSTLVQQRLAFSLICLNSLYYLYTMRKNIGIVILLASLFILIFLEINLSDLISSSSRLNSFNDSNRMNTFYTSIDFIINNPLFGGYYKFLTISEVSPHNILLNSWIRGGFIGFIAISTMITIIFKKSFRILKNKKINHPVNIYITLALINYILLSFTHNEGITTGHAVNFILITIFIMINYSSKINRDSLQKQNRII